MEEGPGVYLSLVNTSTATNMPSVRYFIQDFFNPTYHKKSVSGTSCGGNWAGQLDILSWSEKKIHEDDSQT